MSASEKVEISATEYETLRKGYGLLDKLYNDPTNGVAVKKLVEKATGVRSPELALIESVTAPRDAAIADLSKKIDDMQRSREDDNKAARDAREEREFRAEIDEVQKRYSFTEEGMQKVFDRMKAKKNPDVESAAAWVLSQEPKAKPVTGSPYAPQSLNLYGSQKEDEQWRALNENPLAFFDQEVANVLNEFANA